MLKIYIWSYQYIICENTVRIILTRQVVYGFIPKMKHLILMMLLQLIKVILNLSSIKLISAAAANGILEDATIAVPLKYLSNFLYNCKVELKLK